VQFLLYKPDGIISVSAQLSVSHLPTCTARPRIYIGSVSHNVVLVYRVPP